jgi:hypothetical protein
MKGLEMQISGYTVRTLGGDSPTRTSVHLTMIPEKATSEHQYTPIAFMCLVVGVVLVIAPPVTYCKGDPCCKELEAAYMASTQNMIHVHKGTLPPGQRDYSTQSGIG